MKPRANHSGAQARCRQNAAVSADSVTYRSGPATGDAPGGNNLNQTASRGTLKTHVSGRAHKDATVTVAGATASRESPGDRYWDYALPNYAQYTTVSLAAALAGQTTQTASVLALTRPANEVLAYDEDGNLIDDSLWHYTWDAENRLVGVNTSVAASAWGAPSRTLAFTYD